MQITPKLTPDISISTSVNDGPLPLVFFWITNSSIRATAAENGRAASKDSERSFTERLRNTFDTKIISMHTIIPNTMYSPK